MLGFLPCDIGANHGRLMHVECGHGWASRPRDASSVAVLDELLCLFGYPLHSGAALLRGALPLRYCSGRFGPRWPSWRLPAVGAVAGSVMQGGEVGSFRVSAVVPLLAAVHAASGGAVGWKELEVHQKNSMFSVFHLEEVAVRLVHCGGRGSDANPRERIQVPSGGGIWNLYSVSVKGKGSGDRATGDCTETRLQVLCM